MKGPFYVKIMMTLIASFLFENMQVIAQAEKGDKEIIIIEKTVDSKGNVLSKSTKRFNGKYSEDEIQDIIGEDTGPAIRSYDLDGLGFGEDLEGIFQSDRPTIGVNLNFNAGIATVEKVNPGSGAAKADIRNGDQLISISGIAVSSIDDIYDILDRKSKGDKVKIVIFRDGQELEKEVELGLKDSSNMLFDIPEGGLLRLFGEGGGLPFSNMDSLLQRLGDKGSLLKQFNLDELGNFNLDDDDNSKSSQKPSLGAFIDDSGSQILVTDIIKESPASRAGLKVNDVILRMDDNIVTSFREVSAFLNTKNVGETIELEIERNGVTQRLEVTLE